MFEPAGWDQPGALVLWHAGTAPGAGSRLGHRPVGAERAARVREARALPQPDRRVEDQLLDQRRVIGGEPPHQRRAPGITQHREFRQAARATDEGRGRRNVAHRLLAPHQGRVRLGRLRHLGRARAAPIAAQVQAPDIKTAPGDVVHPGQPAERQVERRMRRVGRAMHHQQRPVGPRRQALRPLVAQEQLDPRVAGRHHMLLGHDCRRGLRLGLGLHDQGGGEEGRGHHGTTLHGRVPGMGQPRG